MVLWPGCEGRAEFSLHTKNVRSMLFVVKRRGCCCNLSGGVALIVWFTTNGMCVKNNTTMYVARASNNRVIPMEWSWWVTSNNVCEPGEQLIVLANGDDESDLVGWSLLLLAATVRSFAHMPLGISDRNTIMGQMTEMSQRNKTLEAPCSAHYAFWEAIWTARSASTLGDLRTTCKRQSLWLNVVVLTL